MYYWGFMVVGKSATSAGRQSLAANRIIGDAPFESSAPQAAKPFDFSYARTSAVHSSARWQTKSSCHRQRQMRTDCMLWSESARSLQSLILRNMLTLKALPIGGRPELQAIKPI